MMQSKESSTVQLPIGRTPPQLASPVASISSSDASPPPPEPSEAPQGAYRQGATEESYVGPTHWQAVLETVC